MFFNYEMSNKGLAVDHEQVQPGKMVLIMHYSDDGQVKIPYDLPLRTVIDLTVVLGGRG